MSITTSLNQKDFGNPLAGQSDRIQLPFPNLRLYWHNGNPQAEKQGAKHFGGWFAGMDDFIADLQTMGAKPEEATGFIGPEVWVSREGKEYSVYSARAVYAAPIATRVSWYPDKPGGSAKGHVNILVYLAVRNTEKKLVPFAPAVLGGKSYSGKAIQDAFKLWVSETQQLRAASAPGVPVSMFYVPVGTFGTTRYQEMRGGNSAQSPIVPCQYGKPSSGAWDESTLAAHFVGDNIGGEMMNLLKQAQEWLNDKPTSDDQQQPTQQQQPSDEDPFA